jgi:hypothetical protein
MAKTVGVGTWTASGTDAENSLPGTNLDASMMNNTVL